MRSTTWPDRHTASARPRPAPLPHPLSTLIGREAEVAQLVALLGQHRIVTVLGVGGVGKSRLALEVAHELAAAHAELVVAFVRAGVGDVHALAARVADALGAPLPPSLDPVTTVARACAGGPTLIVLDALEGLAGDPAVHEALVAWLEASADTRLLVTTRHGLAPDPRLAGALAGPSLPLGPLALGGPTSAAVRLLEARAASPAWRHDDPALSELAARVDGLPLGLELLAARASWLRPADLLVWLGPRGAASHAAAMGDALVAPSWRALDPAARAALTALAVTCADPSAELAQRLVDAAAPGAGLEAIDRLVAASLLTATTSREGPALRLLDLVRAHARQHGDPDILARAVAALDAHLIDLGTADGTHFDPLAATKAAAALAARDEFHACFGRALDPAAPPGARERGLRAAATFLRALLRTHQPAELAGPALALIESPARDDDSPRPLFFALLAALYVYLPKPSGAPVVARIRARLAAHLAHVADPRERLELDLHELGAAQYQWDFSRDPAELDALVARAEAIGPAYAVRATYLAVLHRTALGDAEGADLSRLEDAARRAEGLGLQGLAAAVRTNIGHVAVQLGRPHLALEALAVAGAAAARAHLELMPLYVARERSRALVDLGLAAEGARTLDEAIAGFEAAFAERTAVEAALDRAALDLETGAVARARARLAALSPRVEARFELAFHAALTHAAHTLLGSVDPPVEAWVGMVEDHTLALYRALGRDVDDLHATRARLSFRGRQARRLFDSVRALGRGDGLGVSLDGHHLAARARWVDLTARPVLRALWQALCDRRFAARGAAISRIELAELLWPGERLSLEVRDNRLHASLSGLRKLGPGDAVETVSEGVRLRPDVALVRVAVGALGLG